MKLTIHMPKFIVSLVLLLTFLPLISFANVEKPLLSFDSGKPVEQNNLTIFLDKFFSEQMQQQHIPGAAIVVVKDGQILISKGYGYADINKGTLVDPDKTLFRVASITKLFTATAIIQLVEQGKLNLGENINHYLKNFQIKNHSEKPITVADLLLHTAGFEENFFSLLTYDRSEVVSLERHLQKYQPSCAYPSNEMFSYSNYGYALAGYLVETVSGMSFENYVKTNIFIPLEMKNSDLIAPSSEKDFATGYKYQDKHYQAVNFYYTKSIPSMGLITTATDLIPFMIAHLQKGIYQNKTVLSQSLIQLMQTRQFAGHPKLPGSTFGFRDLVKNGQRAIRHDGRVSGFQSLMYLIPEQNLGFFLVYNCSENNFYLDFTQAFLNFFFVPQVTPPVPINDYKERTKKYVGNYRNLRYSHSTIEKLDTLVSQYYVSANIDGTIALHSPEKSLGNWIEIEPLLFKKTDEDSYLAFKENQKGQVTMLCYNYWFLERLPFYEADDVQMGLIYFFATTFFLASLYLLALLIKGVKEKAFFEKPFIGKFIAFLISLLNCLFLPTWLLSYQAWYEEISFKIPISFILLLCLPLISLALTFTLPVWVKVICNHQPNKHLEKILFCLFTLISWAFILFLHYWNLLGFNFY